MGRCLKIVMLVFVMAVTAGLSGQSFYVAIVKGEVFYKDVLLKARDKIELNGNLRFTTAMDYVKVSGPTGIHTIRPLRKQDGGYEFLRAVKAELFPAAKPLNSFVLSTHIMAGDMLGIHDENEWSPEYFVGGERVRLLSTLKKRDQKNLHWVYRTQSGKLHQSVPKVKGQELELRAKDFRVHSPGDSVVGGMAYLFLIRDPTEFQTLVKERSLGDVFDAAGKESTTSVVVPLSFILVAKVIPRTEIFPDLLFAFVNSGKTELNCFMLPNYCMLDGDGYSEVLEELYGTMNFHRVNRAVVEHLRERRRENSRYRELWKLNR